MFKRHSRKLFVISVIAVLVFTFSMCMEQPKELSGERGAGFAGAAKCIQCHSEIHNTYQLTAHNTTSAAATTSTVKGNFNEGSNAYHYRPDVKVQMENRGDGLYQVAYQNNIEKQANRFDISIGSGRKAQTYLYWSGEKVYQLPVSFSVPAKSWVNSPGYPAKQVRFDRNIPVGCFECHSSNIEVTTNEAAGKFYINNYNRNSLIYGLDCERCHGPAAQHVTFHQENPSQKLAKFIAPYSSLSRVQKIDMCAVCHAGLQETLKSTFNFRPGDTLNNSYFPNQQSANVKDIDVHGNQKQLLAASQCYVQSNQLSCTSCHNVHASERDNKALFSKRCMSCHIQQSHTFCSLSAKGGIDLSKNCIDCHMPARPSKLIQLLSNGQKSPTPNLVRTHYINIYPEETKKFLLSKHQK